MMQCRSTRIGCGLALGLGLLVAIAAGADETEPLTGNALRNFRSAGHNGTPVSGPVLTFDYTGQASNDTALADFLYFVPLISPEPVTVSESSANTLRVRIVSIRQETKSDRFSVHLAFAVSGHGFRHYTIDPSEVVRRRERHLEAGKTLKKKLDYIRFEGPGKGRLEIGGRVEGGGKVVTHVRLHFDERGVSPVTIGLKDVRSVDGALKNENEIVARVNLLEFLRDGTPPRMGVRVASVSRHGGSDNFFQNFKGRFVGMVANMLLDPIAIPKIGNDTMLNLGRALLDREPSFTFPAAGNLKN